MTAGMAAVLAMAGALRGQTEPAKGLEVVKAGGPAAPMAAPPADEKRPFAGWESLRGQVVVVDFWATWCVPCLPVLDRIAAMEKAFAGKPVRFLTVALDTPERVKKYLGEKGISVQTFVDDGERTTAKAWGVRSVPSTAIVDAQGKVVAVTLGENVTEAVVGKVLAGEKVQLPVQARVSNLSWDVEEVQWADGAEPVYQVVIKPIETSSGGYLYKPGGNRISGDGSVVLAMVVAAWQTDTMHMDVRTKLPAGQYRFAAVVPKGREEELLPSLQEGFQRTFGFRARWEEVEKEVLVLTHDPSVALKESEAAAPEAGFGRGKITMKKQTAGQLAERLPNWLKKPVVDETGLGGVYDFDLEYRSDGEEMLREGLKKYGLAVVAGQRKVKMLVVEGK
jgi:uncharacterized protein (TIGR03435 family)